MDDDTLKDAFWLLFAFGMMIFIFCYSWACCDRLGWVRFIAALPLPGKLKMILLGWF